MRSHSREVHFDPDVSNTSFCRPGYTEEILSASNGGVDVILEMLTNVNLATDLTLLRFRGRVVVSSSSDPGAIDATSVPRPVGRDRGTVSHSSLPATHAENQFIRLPEVLR